jgi:IclR family acetate operon transcriptional repressor
MTPPRSGSKPASSPDHRSRAPKAGELTGMAAVARAVPQQPGERRTPLLKAMRVVEWMIDAEQPSYGVREIAQALDIPPSTAHRLLAMLEEADVVEADEASARYRISLQYYRLACRLAATRYPVNQVAVAGCRELADSTGESVYLGLYDSRARTFMYVESFESRNPVNYVMAKHEMRQLYPGAGGLSILAFLPPAEQEVILGELSLEKVTDRTVTDPAQIRADLREIREQGYVISVGRRIVGGAGVGAPLYGPDGQIFGNIVMALPEQRFLRYDSRELGRQVVATAQAISSRVQASGQQ